jgi:cysteine desulfurase / selenocysteine lyase
VNAYKDFGPFDGKVWLNVASEGPLPHAAVAALKDALEWKLQPFQLTIPKFTSVPYQLKLALGTMVNVDPQDVILGNSATYGLQILANGLPLNDGDEVLLMQNDFPTNIVPWLALGKKGVKVRQVKAAGHVLTPEELLNSISSSTKVVCLSWVHTFSGHKIDVIKIGEICRERKIVFILNVSQAVGAFPVDVSRLPVDAIICAGYKWMLGPYGTGFCWIKPEVRDTLNYNHAYWQSMLNETQLMSTEEIVLSEHKSARNYDTFGTANFFNYVPWTASIQYVMKLGMDKVEQYNQQLVSMIVEGLDQKQFKLISPADPASRTNLVVFSHLEPQRNESIMNRLKDAGIFLALWKGNLRVSPHIHNTRYDVEKFIKVLNRHPEQPHERQERGERHERGESQDRPEGQEAGERQERSDEPRQERSGEPRQERSGEQPRQDRGGRHGRHRGGRGDRHGRHGRHRGGRGGEGNAPRPEGGARNENAPSGESPVRNEGNPSSERSEQPEQPDSNESSSQ